MVSKLTRDIQMDLLNLLDWSISIMYERFSSTKIYPKILLLDKHRKERSIKAFDYNEQKMLVTEMHRCFASFIKQLKKYCPSLTKMERMICCLSLRFPPLTVSLCFGNYNTNCIKTHKNRIKKKMLELSDFKFLFDFIFSPPC